VPPSGGLSLTKEARGARSRVLDPPKVRRATLLPQPSALKSTHKSILQFANSALSAAHLPHKSIPKRQDGLPTPYRQHRQPHPQHALRKGSCAAAVLCRSSSCLCVTLFFSLQLHAPPGGASSISLGWNTEPAPQRTNYGRKPAAAEPVYAPAAPVYAARNENYAAPVAAAPAACAPVTSSHISSNMYASGANQNSGESFVSRQCARAEKSCSGRQQRVGSPTARPSFPSSALLAGNFLTDRRTTRVAAPPGGRSSFTLG
jgi:hypothetical protein